MKKNCKDVKESEENEAGANIAIDEIQDALTLAVQSSHDTWMLDSSVSFHITRQRDVLENYVAGNHGKVYLIDGEPLVVIGISDVNLKLANGLTWKICNVPSCWNTTTKMVYDDSYFLSQTKCVTIIYDYSIGSHEKSFHDSFRKLSQ